MISKILDNYTFLQKILYQLTSQIFNIEIMTDGAIEFSCNDYSIIWEKDGLVNYKNRYSGNINSIARKRSFQDFLDCLKLHISMRDFEKNKYSTINSLLRCIKLSFNDIDYTQLNNAKYNSIDKLGLPFSYTVSPINIGDGMKLIKYSLSSGNVVTSKTMFSSDVCDFLERDIYNNMFSSDEAIKTFKDYIRGYLGDCKINVSSDGCVVKQGTYLLILNKDKVKFIIRDNTYKYTQVYNLNLILSAFRHLVLEDKEIVAKSKNNLTIKDGQVIFGEISKIFNMKFDSVTLIISKNTDELLHFSTSDKKYNFIFSELNGEMFSLVVFYEEKVIFGMMKKSVSEIIEELPTLENKL